MGSSMACFGLAMSFHQPCEYVLRCSGLANSCLKFRGKGPEHTVQYILHTTELCLCPQSYGVGKDTATPATLVGIRVELAGEGS